MQIRDFKWVLLVPTLLLLLPLAGELTMEDFEWSVADFVAMWGLMAGIGLAYKLATAWTSNLTYRAAAGLALLGVFFLFWVSGAVGIIGEENPGNAFYILVPMAGVFGAGLARFRPLGMARTLFAMATIQALVPTIAVLAWPADFSPGVAHVFVLNAGWVLLFALSGFLFRHAADQSRRPASEVSA